MSGKKVLFIDRDGTILREPEDCRLDDFRKMAFLEGVISALRTIVSWQEYELVLVTNQDGLGTAAFPKESFLGPHTLMLSVLESEGIVFSAQHIDCSFPEEKTPYRKPGTGMLQRYFSAEYDLQNSFVIGDRLTDVELAVNLGCKAFLIAGSEDLGANELTMHPDRLRQALVRKVAVWGEIVADLRLGTRIVRLERRTSETEIYLELDLDGKGTAHINTGIAFLDHMLEQVARHGEMDLRLETKGDLEVDEHHTIEDTAIVFGDAVLQAIGKRNGMERYGFVLPMDDCLAQCAIDFGGRADLIWQAGFKREYIGKMPTEMIPHFFKSFCHAARCNLALKADGVNDHHKAESLFKAFAKALKMAKRRTGNWNEIPTTKNSW